VGTDAGRLWIVVGRWSVLIAPSHVIVGLMLLVLSLAVAVVSLRLGKFPVTTQEVIDALQGQGRKIVQVVVVKWKLPRIVLGLVAGLALGVAGAVFQTITRNPLGSPDLIGFSTGAQTGILVSVLLLPGGMLSASLASFIGGAAVGTVTYLVSLRGGFTGLRFILVGIAISSMLVSVNRWLLVRVDDDEGLGALKAVTGTLGAARWPVVTPTCLAIGVTVALILVVPALLVILLSFVYRDYPHGEQLFERIAVIGVEDTELGVSHRQSFEITSRADRVARLGVYDLSAVLRYVPPAAPPGGAGSAGARSSRGARRARGSRAGPAMSWTFGSSTEAGPRGRLASPAGPRPARHPGAGAGAAPVNGLPPGADPDDRRLHGTARRAHRPGAHRRHHRHQRAPAVGRACSRRIPPN